MSFSRTGCYLETTARIFCKGYSGLKVTGLKVTHVDESPRGEEEEMDDSVRAARSLLENALSMMSPQSSSSSKLSNSGGQW